MLIQKGADPSLKDNEGQSLLHFAAQGGNKFIINKLLSLGLGIDVPVLLLNQPIFWAEGDVYTQAIHTFMHFCYSSVYVSYSLNSCKIAIALKDTSVIQIFVTIPLQIEQNTIMVIFKA